MKVMLNEILIGANKHEILFFYLTLIEYELL